MLHHAIQVLTVRRSVGLTYDWKIYCLHHRLLAEALKLTGKPADFHVALARI